MQEDLQLIVTVLDAFSSLNLEEDLFDQVTLLLMVYSTLIQFGSAAKRWVIFSLLLLQTKFKCVKFA